MAEYLRTGGQRAPEPPEGYMPYVPDSCPICGGATFDDPEIGFSRQRGVGWGCRQDKNHYWQWRALVLKKALGENPWYFPPVVIRDGEQIRAWDGIQGTDEVLYQGVLRSEIK